MAKDERKIEVASGSGKDAKGEKMLELKKAHKRDLNETVPNAVPNSEFVLPFVKKLTEWKECESTEAFKRWPQRPHFNGPWLFQIPELVRERFALGLLLSFLDISERLENQGKDLPRSLLDEDKEALVALETYGFDSRGPLSQIDEILSVKDKEAHLLEEQHGFERGKSSKEPELNTTTPLRSKNTKSKKKSKKQL